MVKIAAAIDGFRAGLGWHKLDEFKFSSTRKSIIKDLLRYVQQFDFESYVAVIDKSKIVAAPQFASGENLCNYAIKELLLKLALSEPIIVIDGVADKEPALVTRTYLRKALQQHGIRKCKISFVDSRKDPLIQLADLVAGSVMRSFDERKADRDEYIKLLKPKIKDIYIFQP